MIRSARWMLPASRAASAQTEIGKSPEKSMSRVFRQEGQHPVGRLAGLRGGADDGAGILAHDLQPGANVIGVAHRRHDAERGAAECAEIISAISSSKAYFFVPKEPEKSRFSRL
jgi:hypothetical protein